MRIKTTKILKITFWAIITIAGLVFINNYKANALTIADKNNIPSACPDKGSTEHCTVFIDSISVNSFTDYDTSYTARITPVPYGYLIPNQTVNISWTDNTAIELDELNKVKNYIVKYGCGNDVYLYNDDHVIGNAAWNVRSITWTVPSDVANYKYCKIWVYAKGYPNQQYSSPTLGVSNTRAFETQPPPQTCSITNFSANDYSINKGDNVELNWNANNCNSCTASAGPSNSYWNGNQAIYGSKTIYSLQDATTFTLTCSGSANTDIKHVTVTVQTPPPQMRYSCNTSTYQCYQAVFGTYATYNDCANSCQPNIQPLSVSCYASPNSPQINQTVTFFSNVSGGDGIYYYYWSGYASGNNSYIQQTFNSAGTYTAYLTVTDSNGRTGSTSCSVYVQGQTIAAPTLSFWADKYNLNQGETTYLRWVSNNTNYCVASNGWTGTKSTSNYEASTPNNQTTYTLTCYGNGGQITKSITLYVASPTTTLSFTKLGRNLSNGDRAYSKVIRVAQGDVVEFYLTVTAGSANDLQNVVITDPLPAAFSYKAGTTKVNGIIQADGITTTGLSLGTVSRGTSKTILFQALSNNPGTNLTYTNTAQVTASGINALTDSATITYGLVAGASTVATGAEDSLIISLIISLGLAFLIWYYLKFNPQGKLVFAKLENKIRDLRLEYTKKQLLKK